MLTGRIIVKGQLFGAVVLNGPVYHGHRLDLTRSPVNEYWSQPPNSHEFWPAYRCYRHLGAKSRSPGVARYEKNA